MTTRPLLLPGYQAYSYSARYIGQSDDHLARKQPSTIIDDLVLAREGSQIIPRAEVTNTTEDAPTMKEIEGTGTRRSASSMMEDGMMKQYGTSIYDPPAAYVQPPVSRGPRVTRGKSIKRTPKRIGAPPKPRKSRAKKN